MSNTLDPKILKYIDTAIEKQRVIFRTEIDRDRELNIAIFRADLKLMGETVDLKIRDTAREVVREEVEPRFKVLETKMDMVAREVGGINGEIGGMKVDISDIRSELTRRGKQTDSFLVEMRASREELKELRKDSNRHGVRLTRLERATA